jgi:membrane protein DedA with SNARE-associated domain
MHESINYLVVNYGLAAIFVLMLTNGFASTPPSELVIAIGGALILLGKLSLVPVLLSVIGGNIFGAFLLYFIGRYTGYKWIIKIVQFINCKFPSTWLNYLTSHFSQEKLLIIEAIFKTQGAFWICIFRCLPVVRSIVSLPAGALNMPVFTFIIYSLFGMTIWAVFWICIGYFLSDVYLNNGVFFSLSFLLILILAMIAFKRYISKVILCYQARRGEVPGEASP